MKKSKKSMVNIRKFMIDYLDTEYVERAPSKKQRRKQEELEVKTILGVSLSREDKKRLKKKKFVLTHKGMFGYLSEKGLPLPTKVSFEEAENQDHDGSKYVYVLDEAKVVIPYLVPRPLEEERLAEISKTLSNNGTILKKRISTLWEIEKEYRRKGMIEEARLIKNRIIEDRTELYKMYQNKKSITKEEVDVELLEPTEKKSRIQKQNKVYSYKRRMN